MWGALSRLFVKSDNIKGDNDDDDNNDVEEGGDASSTNNRSCDPETEIATEAEFAAMEKQSQEMTDTLESKQVRFFFI